MACERRPADLYLSDLVYAVTGAGGVEFASVLSEQGKSSPRYQTSRSLVLTGLLSFYALAEEM